ncbi:hypothetical protein JUJ52_15495 [Virgibacillus sp. AGTR]|uniref:hypothetical protein n=1 Tax=Virgibacillus sp. AGTR TaxID=2812055 RepID=UPI001D16D76E|nr:hypothetical protein [Virgibacillus sp. AGTR]MCC2251362.1 hypothetical protein [Virgibacillus sp. AGTR]
MKTSKIINIIGVVLVSVTGVLHWFYYDAMKSWFTGLPGLMIIIILFSMTFYKPRNEREMDE